MLEEKLDALSQLGEHKAMPFPPGFRGLERPARGRGGWMCGDVRPLGARWPSLSVCAD
ncbi:hypothetical protein SAMN02787144_10443 [Streptomyces atratus]|uniref:Uncharacterized protein n=1 Tax=Streptomyces atratus TaxID=1893 RepID=A0A1K2FAF8_STRAR|nr:hypothetical protein SAMN02787144_10443 [Streptomyces atratus]